MPNLRPTFQFNQPSPVAPKNLFQSTDYKSQLDTLGVDTGSIDQEVESEIQTAQSNQKTKIDLKRALFDATKQFPDMAREDIYKGVLSSYKRKGYTVDGIDIDKELGIIPEAKPIEAETSTQITTPDTEDPGFISRVAEKSPEVLDKGLTYFKNKFNNALFEGISNAPKIAGDIAGFTAGILQKVDPFTYLQKAIQGDDYIDSSKLFKGAGATSKEQLEELLEVDTADWSAGAGEFISEAATLAIPGAKIEQVSTKLPVFLKGMENLARKAPGVFNKFSNKFTQDAVKGATDVAKLQIAGEGETSPTGIIAGTVVNPAFNLAGRGASKLVSPNNISKMKKIFRPSPKNKAAVIDDDMASILGSLKENQKKPENILGLYDDLVDINKNLYTKHINPALQEGVEKGGKLNMVTIVDDVLPKIGENKYIKGKALSGTFGRSKDAKNFEKVVKQVQDMGELDFNEAEVLKQYTSALIMADKSSKQGVLSSLQKDFVMKLNTGLQDQMESQLKKLTGAGVKQYKTEYGAIARHLDELNRRIISESKLSGDSLFAGLGKISGIRDIAQGNITQGFSTILTGEILKLMKDPDELLKKVIKDLYSEKLIPEVVKKTAGPALKAGLAKEVGEGLDKSDLAK